MIRDPKDLARMKISMSTLSNTEPQYWLRHSRWLIVGGSLIAAIVALIAEGPGAVDLALVPPNGL